MKVLHIESGRHLYGGALQVVMLARGLEAQGIECHLACPAGSAIAAAMRPCASGVHELAMRGDVDIGTVGRLLALMRRIEPDVVHLHSRFGTDVWGALAARGLGLPVVFSRRVDNPEPRWWVAIKYRLYDRVVAISNGIREVLLAEGLPPDKVVCVHSAVDTDVYRPEPADRAGFRAAFGLPDGAPVLAVVAQFIERKGHRVLLDALPAVLAAQPALRVLFFGQGPQEAALKARVAEQGLHGCVTFAGFRDDLPRMLPCIDVLAHPAATEGLGVSLLQAAACGVAIVASRTGGIPEIVQPGLTGELVPPGDADALAQALVRVLGDADLRRRYGQAARAWTLAHFSADAMVAGNRAAYEAVIARKPGRRYA